MSILDKDSMTEDHWSNNPRFKKDTSMRQDDDDIQDYVVPSERLFLITFKQVTRNETLEEVAREFDKMKSLGDTAASFAAYVRNMKK